jgi:virulence-associated protein VapD
MLYNIRDFTVGVIIMYAIAFDLDTEMLKKTYPSGSWNNAYNDIKQALIGHGFSRQQGSVYFGDMKSVNAVTCVVAAQDLTQTFPWFAASVRDIRMLRIEDDNDLKPAIEKMLAVR